MWGPGRRRPAPGPTGYADALWPADRSTGSQNAQKGPPPFHFRIVVYRGRKRIPAVAAATTRPPYAE
ncbi:hypothetical protein MCAG_00561 [Micromonospora sp. ATCC 39149]|nr:hypothetical protein MCAG_00561 [Micromonospora sp. ATCC 39149]